MKILAIRGCNLASLAGEFEIDLSHGPLGAAGVFAIIGPTGAGKSTLLDAMCVALFDRTPRLTNRSTVVVGRGEDDPSALGAQDVRTILRRGAAAGYAEVDFESGDLRRYRARWSVRRARDRSDGNLQAQQITLTAIDGGEKLGGTRTETLDAIHERLGLTFDQFRRSALLAQGDFAAFLRADGKDRSELLERMTGTEIYSRLSMAAHQRATQAEAGLTARRDAALAIAILDEAARIAMEVELADATAAVAATRAALAHTEASARWLGEAERRVGERETARAALAAAAGSVEAAQAERAELALRRRAEQLRGAWDAAERLDRQLAIAQAELVVSDDAASAVAERQRVVTARRAELAQRHAPIREARLAAKLVERAPGGQVALTAAADAAWLRARAGLAGEIAQWGELGQKLAQQAAQADAIAGIDRAMRTATEVRAREVRARDAAKLEHQQAVARHHEARREAERFQQKRGPTLDAARKAEDQARLHCAEIERLGAIAASAAQSRAALAELEHQLATLAGAAKTDAKQRRAAEKVRAAALAVRGERERVAIELRRAAGYEHARAELVEGEPCPLCGAEAHPWHGRGAFDEVIRGAEAQLAEIAARIDATTAQLAEIAVREQGRAGEHARLDAARVAIAASSGSAVVAWREQLGALGELILVDDPASPDAQQLAAEREVLARSRLEAARAHRHQTEAVAKAAAEAVAAVQLQQASVDALAERLAGFERKLGELDASLERQRGERAGRAERHAELAGELATAASRWLDALPDRAAWAPRFTAAHFASALTELATAWQRCAERVVAADAALTHELAAIDREARELDRVVAEAGARRETTRATRDRLIAELAVAAAHLESERASAGFDADALRRLLAEDSTAVERVIEKLATLDRAVDLARAVLAERERLVEDHAAARPASPRLEGVADRAAQPRETEADRAAYESATDLADRAKDLAGGLATAEQLVAKLAAALAADLEARARRAAALATLADAESHVEIDRMIGEVIGSHDGKLFRSFAQSLTLDALLEVANAHLEELAPRYQLERVPKHDLELQVIDRDLGSEVRSVQSLSGGESFLVSLALALGLSSMSAHDVRVRTLLIDEGFGTLDPATLDGALSVLDALQATGRQVGVISHVPQLVERVGAHVRVVSRGGGRSEVITSA